jgi:acetyl esterase/lipase
MAVLSHRSQSNLFKALIALGGVGAIVGLWFGLGLLNSKQATVAQSEAETVLAYEQRLELKPNDQGALRQLVQLHWQQEQYKTAIDYLERLIKLQPDNVSLHFQKAGLHALAGQPEQEEAAYDVIIARRPNHVMALTNKAILRSTKGDLEAARKLFAQAEASAADREVKKTVRDIAENWLRTRLKVDKPWQTRVVYQPSDQVKVISDIVYAQSKTRALKLDLYLPQNKPRHAIPGIIVIRGGAWRQGDKEGFAFMASRLAESGFAAASIEYRTSEEAPFPAALYDVRAAVKWMRLNASQHGIDEKAIGAIGGSSGAHLAVLLATSDGVSELEETQINGDKSSQIQAVVGMATPASLLDFDQSRMRPIEELLLVSSQESPETWALASPLSHVDATDPPLLLFHSDADNVVSYQQSLELIERYTEAGAPPSKLINLPGASHAFWYSQTWFDGIMDTVIDFFKSELVAPTRNNN